MATHSAQGPLFLARCARVQGAQFPAIASGSVYHCVSQALTTLRELKNIASESYVASWAAVIRNTVIRRWIDELGVTEAVSRANQIKRPLHSEMQGPFEFVLPINWADFYCRNYCFGLAAGDVPPPTTEPVCAFLELRQPGVQKRLVVPLLLPI